MCSPSSKSVILFSGACQLAGTFCPSQVHSFAQNRKEILQDIIKINLNMLRLPAIRTWWGVLSSSWSKFQDSTQCSEGFSCLVSVPVILTMTRASYEDCFSGGRGCWALFPTVPFPIPAIPLPFCRVRSSVSQVFLSFSSPFPLGRSTSK